VATIAGEEITRQEWLSELETRYGEETLRDMINAKVIETLAKEYKIKIPKKTLEQEITMFKQLYGTQGYQLSNQELEKQVKLSLLLEEILTKDVVVSKQEMESYYHENRDFYEFPSSYHLSQIIVSTLEEAEKTITELEDGSNFAALAMERSIDEFSANRGGDIGVIREDDEVIGPLTDTAKEMDPGTWSDPIQVNDGYAVIYLHEKIAAKTYTFEEVKDQIRRQLALEQTDVPVSAQTFWSEAEVEWFYGNERNR